MKTGLFFSIIILPLLNLNGQMNAFRINGEIKNLTNEVTVYLVNNVTDDTVAEAVTKRGKICIEGHLSAVPEWFSIRIKGQNKWPTFLVENKTISVRLDISNWPESEIANDKLNDIVKEYIKRSRQIRSIIDSFEHERTDAVLLKDTITANNLSKRIELENKQIKKYRIDFIRCHPNSSYTPWLILNTSGLTWKEKQTEYNRLPNSIKNSNYGVRLFENIKYSKLQETVKVGSQIPNFILKSLKGDKFSVYDIIRDSKFTLIDFWASWCHPCRGEIPNLKKVYDEFHDKGFDILSITIDKNAAAWKAALDQEKMPWHHGCEVNDNDATALFDITGIPAYMLVDGDGKIVAIDFNLSKVKSEGGKLIGGDYLYNKIYTIIKKTPN